MDNLCPFCSAYHWLSERVSSTSAQHPEFEMCCQRGKIKLSGLSTPPQPLYNLFVGNDPEGQQFRQNIVQYNASLAFTSMGVDVNHSICG